jgi:hypothetical protein
MMLLVFVGAVLGTAITGLVVFGAMCLAIKNDDRKGLPPQAPGHIASLTRWLLDLSGSRSARSPSADGQSQLVESAAGQPGPSWPEGR